jgi:hypothetical protein
MIYLHPDSTIFSKNYSKPISTDLLLGGHFDVETEIFLINDRHVTLIEE